MGRNLEEFVRLNYQKAIEYHEIQVYYQPVIRTASRQLCGFEALARWVDPQLGMIYPDEFIPVLEKEQLIHHIDIAVINQVCARLRSSITNGEIPVPVSVNLSRMDFTLCDIFKLADDIVSDYQIPHDFICFEITESVMAEEKDMMIGIVDQFRSAGYQIWMDDFGSAYSSLNILKEIHFDELKLDMCFLRPFNLRSKRIATAVVEMAKSIDIHTLAEGVETEEQFYYLRNIGCEKVQGYFFGRPLPYETAMLNLQEQGIGIELPQDRQYYDEIGRIDFLSAVPFMTRAEHDAITTARQLNSIPLTLVEFSADHFRVLFYNSAFEETAARTGMFPDIFTQESLCVPQPYNLISDRLINLIDSVKSGGDGRLMVTSHEDYYEVRARRMAGAKTKYCVLIQVTNLSKDSQSASTGYLDEFARLIYALYERITLIDFEHNCIRPLVTATRRDLLSGRDDLASLAKEYAEKYIYAEDREAYLRFFAPQAIRDRFRDSNHSSFSRLFRTNVRHGQFAWKEYTLLKIDEDRVFILVRHMQDNVFSFVRNHEHGEEDKGLWNPSRMWNSLIRSDLIRLFWKDGDRRFVGASKAFLDYYGFASEQELLGKNDEELGWHVHPDSYMNDELQVIHEGVTLHNSPGRCMSDGDNKEILASKTPLYDDNGSICGLMGYFIDRELLTANDKRGTETNRRDLLTGLLNSRGISEEATAFRDEYYLRGKDFVRIHIAVNDFNSINEQFGFDFGDRVLIALGTALKQGFGRTCVVGRCEGHKFVVLHQIENLEEARQLRAKIKEISASVKSVDKVPLTLYLSVGYVLFSEYLDLEEQAKMSEVRLHADHDHNISAESRIDHASEIFHLFDELPFSYSVYHVTHARHSGLDNAVIFYVNRKYEQVVGVPARQALGHSVRELFPAVGDEWFEQIRRAAIDGESVEGDFVNSHDGKRYRFTARQIIYPGYCAVTWQEI